MRNSPNAIIIVRPGGEILISSEEAKSLFGFWAWVDIDTLKLAGNAI
jgi:hypothetical protein